MQGRPLVGRIICIDIQSHRVFVVPFVGIGELIDALPGFDGAINILQIIWLVIPNHVCSLLVLSTAPSSTVECSTDGFVEFVMDVSIKVCKLGVWFRSWDVASIGRVGHSGRLCTERNSMGCNCEMGILLLSLRGIGDGMPKYIVVRGRWETVAFAFQLLQV